VRTTKVMYWINVSENSGTASPGFSWITAIKQFINQLLLYIFELINLCNLYKSGRDSTNNTRSKKSETADVVRA